MSATIWQKCLGLLEEEYPPQQFNTWLRPLHAEMQDSSLVLLAPNRFVVDWVKKNFYTRIKELVTQFSGDLVSAVAIEIGSKASQPVNTTPAQPAVAINNPIKVVPKKAADYKNSYLNKKFHFDTFVEGNSNQLARAASLQVAERPGDAFNP